MYKRLFKLSIEESYLLLRLGGKVRMGQQNINITT